MDNQVSAKIQGGVKQGDPISPKLFKAIKQEIFNNAQLEEVLEGINIDGELSDLRFADDVALTTEGATDMNIN